MKRYIIPITLPMILIGSSMITFAMEEHNKSSSLNNDILREKIKAALKAKTSKYCYELGTDGEERYIVYNLPEGVVDQIVESLIHNYQMSSNKKEVIDSDSFKGMNRLTSRHSSYFCSLKIHDFMAEQALGPLIEVYTLEKEKKKKIKENKKEIEKLYTKINKLKAENKKLSIELRLNNVKMGHASSNLGNLVFTPSILTNIAIDSIEKGMDVLEIGSARGIDTVKMLLKEANVLAVDVNEQDLSLLKEKVPPEYQDNLTTLKAVFPNDDHFDSSVAGRSFDMVYMSHVAHYLTGPELREGIQKIASLLKNEGRFYFQALTPYAYPYVWNMTQADSALEKEEWPGYFSEEEKVTAQRKRPEAVKMFNLRDDEGKIIKEGAMPDYGHPIHPEIIKRELENHGLKALHIAYASLTPALAQVRSPLTYEEHEKYVKRFVYPLSQNDENQIVKKLEDFRELSERRPDLESKKDKKEFENDRLRKKSNLLWLASLEKDAKTYASNYHNPHFVAQPLITMDSVIAIACKGCQDEERGEKEPEKATKN